MSEQVEIDIKYCGYIERQHIQVKQARKLEEEPIPSMVEYAAIRALSREAIEKLGRIRPLTLGQASRVPGVTPADVAILAIHIETLLRG